MGSILESMTYFWIFGLQLCHIMASIGNNPNLDFANFLLLAFFKYFAFISIRKEAINNIKIDLRSRNDALSSDKHFPF